MEIKNKKQTHNFWKARRAALWPPLVWTFFSEFGDLYFKTFSAASRGTFGSHNLYGWSKTANRAVYSRGPQPGVHVPLRVP